MEVRIRRKIIKKRELTSYSRPYMTIYLNSEYHKRWGKNSTCKNKSCFILKMIYTWKYLILKKDIYIQRGKMGKHSGFKIPWWAIKGYLHLSVSQRLLYRGAVPQSKQCPKAFLLGITKRNGQRIKDYLTFVKEKCQCESRNISGKMILGKRT